MVKYLLQLNDWDVAKILNKIHVGALKLLRAAY